MSSHAIDYFLPVSPSFLRIIPYHPKNAVVYTQTASVERSRVGTYLIYLWCYCTLLYKRSGGHLTRFQLRACAPREALSKRWHPVRAWDRDGTQRSGAAVLPRSHASRSESLQ
jgi:hypothetical protein